MKILYKKKAPAFIFLSLLLHGLRQKQFLPKMFLAVLVFFLSANMLHAQVTEVEPNNTPAQANTLPINNIGTGAINPGGDLDYWKVTTTADGQLNLTLTSTNAINVSAYLFDNNGTTILASNTTAGTVNINTDGLAAGTYYIQINAYYSGQTPTYTIADTLIPAPVANDAEPDSSKATAVTLPLNSTTTGHIGYYYNNHRDTLDYYKITTNGDGLLQLKLTTNNVNGISAYLFDSNGTTVLGNISTNGTSYLNTDGLAAGTYYVQVNSYYNTNFEPYTLTDSLFTPAQANDKEPDSSKATALTLPLNSTTTGHIGYYYNNHRDTLDYYKITTSADGLLQLKLTTNNVNGISAYLLDNNGTTVLGNISTNSTSYLNTDGLAAGTYYVQVNSYYNTNFEPYTLTDSLFTPAQANDAEPDSSKATALTLPLNSTTTGHIGYYYNNHRDTLDYYKITTNADGLLQLKLTTNNVNGISAYLFDSNGTTVLGNISTNGTSYLNTDGLAAGTYYVQVNSYYNTNFEPYTLTDSLFTPAQANDKEPDSSKATALTLPLNSTTTGHIGYYYNNHRDTLDYYKITTSADGLLQLKLTTNNVNGISAYLLDNNGTTVLGNINTNGTSYLNTDGLAAGTYYVQINSYYNTNFEPYTLTDSLFTYRYAADTAAEPNGAPYLAKTLLANRTTPGHINFYYNLQRDSTDWWKINYTGNDGNLNIYYNLEPNISSGGINNVTFQVYADTTAGPISNITTANPSTTVNLTGLAQGYYWIRVVPYYNTQFESYAITDSFTQVNNAQISLAKLALHNTCGSDSLTYNLSGSHSPYTVRLYRDGTLFDSIITTSNTASFMGLNDGNYYATVYGDGATDSAYSKSNSSQFLPPYPSGLSATNISTDSATIHWSPFSCVPNYRIQYKITGTSTWMTINTSNNPSGSYILTGLMPNTMYTFQVASLDNTDGLVSQFSDTANFKTMSALPVTFTNFDGKLQDNQALLNWSTATEINNKGFEVQKSMNGQEFTDIGFVAGNGNSSIVNNYNYIDNKVLSGSNYYRLKQIDLDGNFDYSSTIRLDFRKFNWTVFGNPLTSNSWLQLQLSQKANVAIQIISTDGKIIQTINKGNISEGTYSIPLHLGNVASGMYIIKLLVGDQNFSKQIIK
ncbi:MAG: pre-peptidase C-terminal domain-containing protein [Bacteroidota bacterium]|nr:pre-peptidase C-terminal domain-containing protein [Bacteroidota bacterium]